MEKIADTSEDVWMEWAVAGAVLILIGGVWSQWQTILTYVSGLTEGPARGEFGDSYGGLTALFTALAFFGVILTARLQSRELGYQRKELEQTRAVMLQQTGTLKLQAFENTFFQMLKLLNDVRSEVQVWDVHAVNKATIGRMCFPVFVDNLNSVLVSRHTSNNGLTAEDLGNAFEEMFSRHRLVLGAYFDNLFETLGFILRSSLEENQKDIYARMVAAQFSPPELAVIFYAGLSQRMRGLKETLERFHLLSSLDAGSLLGVDHIEHYEDTAFVADRKLVHFDPVNAFPFPVP